MDLVIFSDLEDIIRNLINDMSDLMFIIKE